MPRLTIRKKLFFSAATLALLVVLLAGLELTLRATSPRMHESIVSTVTYDGIEWHKLNRSFLKKYFSSSDVLIPELKEEQFRVVRTKRSLRVICLGESSMFGVPYEITANIPAMIRKQLRHLYPDREVEVINAGASAINSSVIADLAGEAAALEPDLVLVYLGHNEFYGPEGVGVSWLEKHVPLITGVKHAVKGLAIARALDSLVTPAHKQPARERTLMQQVSNETDVPLASADAERIFSQYERNLRTMITLLQARHIPVMFSTAASNLLFPPFRHGPLGAGEEQRIASLYSSGDLPALMQRLEALSAQAPANAFVDYWMGRADMKLGKFDEARALLVRAKDEDLLKFRAPERTNSILRSVCNEYRVPCIDADSLLRAMSPHGISDTSLFWEHVHPKASGYYAIAVQFVDALLACGLLPPLSPAAQAAEPRLLPFQRDSLSICLLDLAYGDRTMANLVSHWPFSNYAVTPAVLSGADVAQRAIVEMLFRHAAVWDETCYRSAEEFEHEGRWRDAETTYEAVLEEYPYNFYAHYLLGNLFNRTGRAADALRHFDASLASNPDYTQTRVERGLTKINFGKFDDALTDFDEAARRNASADPATAASIAYGRAVVYANKKDYPRALAQADAALALVPMYRAAQQLRAGIYAAMRR